MTAWGNSIIENNIRLQSNENAGYIDYSVNNFELNEQSIAINAGLESIAIEVPYDLNGYSRQINPDIGCFEKQ